MSDSTPKGILNYQQHFSSLKVIQAKPVEVSFKNRLIKILPMLVERPQAFNKTMEKAEKRWGRISTLICRPME